MRKQRHWTTHIIIAAGLVMAACSGGSSSEPATATVSPAESAPVSVDSIGSEPVEDESASAPLTGESIHIVAGWRDAELVGFQRVLDAFTATTGITVEYDSGEPGITSIKWAEQLLGEGIQPDIVASPRPGENVQAFDAGIVLTLDDAGVDTALIESAYSPTALELGDVRGEHVGVLMTASSKSMVWYRPPSFEERGIPVPTTLDEWLASIQLLSNSGTVPFSLAAEGGWPLTDWFENIYLRVAGPDRYRDLFVRHSIPWTDPTVVEAMNIMQSIILPADERMLGGAEGAIETDWTEAIDPLLNGDTDMYLMGGFIAGLMTDRFPDLVPGTDYGIFRFPEIDATIPGPLVVGGDFALPMTNRPETAAFIEFLATAEAAEAWATAPSGWRVNPNLNANISTLGNQLTQDEAQMIRNSQTIVFDGSDMTPFEVAEAGMEALFFSVLRDSEDVMTSLQALEDIALEAYAD